MTSFPPFRAARVFTYPESLDLDIDLMMDEVLAEHALPAEPGPFEVSVTGFVPVHREAGSAEAEFIVSSADFILGLFGTTSKILPPAVVNAELTKRVQKIAAEEVRRVGGRERKRIKEDLLAELLPRAFSKTSITPFLFDTRRRRLIVSATSPKSAENVVSALRTAFGSFPALPLAPGDVSPRQVMTRWLSGTAPLAGRLSVGNEAVLIDPAEHNSRRWSARNDDLQSDALHEHLREGLVAKSLELTDSDRIRCVLGDDLAMKKIKLLDLALDDLDEDNFDDIETELRSGTALLGHELRRVIDVLVLTFDCPECP